MKVGKIFGAITMVLFVAFIFGCYYFDCVSACVGTNEPWHVFKTNDAPPPDPVYLESGYFKAFGLADGLTDQFVTCLAFSKKGILFIGTKDSGVFMLDKTGFSPLLTSPPMPSPNILSIAFSDQDNRLYVGTNSGLAVVMTPVRSSECKASIITTREGLKSNSIFSLCVNGADVIGGTEHGVFTVSGTSFRMAVTRTSAGNEIGKVNSIAVDSEKLIYIATDSSIITTPNMITFNYLNLEWIRAVTKICPITMKKAPRDSSPLSPGIGIGSVNGFHISRPSSMTTIDSKKGLPEDWVTCFGFDNLEQVSSASITLNKNLLDASTSEAADSGSSRKHELLKQLIALKLPYTTITVKGDEVTIKTQDPRSLNANPIFKKIAQELDLWNTLFPSSMPDPKKVSSPELSALQRGLWLGTKNSGVAVFNGEKLVIFNSSNSPMTSNEINDILATPDYVYIATNGGGLVRYGKYDTPDQVSDIEQIIQEKPNCIKTVGSDVYIGAASGAYHYVPGGTAQKIFQENAGLRNVAAICADGSGTLLFGTNGNGIFKMNGGKLSAFTPTSPELPGVNCTALYYAEKKGVIAGFSGYSSRCSKKCVLITPEWAIQNFLPAAGQKIEEYDITDDSQAPASAFMSVADGFFAGFGGGGASALVFFDAKLWQYAVMPTRAVWGRISSIAKTSGSDIYFAGDIGVMKFSETGWEQISRLGGVAIGDSVCAARDTLSDGVWVLQRACPGQKDKCVLTYGGKGSAFSKIIDGLGVTFAQLDPYIFVGTTKGVYKIKKK